MAAGCISRPPDVPFHEWLRWRAREGMRPVRRRDGLSTTMQQEANLWKALMAAFYGDERAEALEEEAVSGEGPMGRPSPTLSNASAAPGIEELQKILAETYDPTRETVDSFVARSFVARVDRAADSLQGLGLEMSEERLLEVRSEAQAIEEAFAITKDLDPKLMVQAAGALYVGASVHPGFGPGSGAACSRTGICKLDPSLRR